MPAMHIDGRTVHVDGVAERDGEGGHGPGRAELLDAEECSGEGGGAGTGGEAIIIEEAIPLKNWLGVRPATFTQGEVN